MSKINRKYIDKHWLVYILRGCLAVLFGLMMLFNGLQDAGTIGLPVGIYLLCMGAIDAVGAIYSSNKKHGWITALLDSLVDVVAALMLLFMGRDSLVASVVILAVYTLASGLIDLVHGFLSTVDPTDRFIRILAGVSGCVIGVVIINAGPFDVVEFYRFFGVFVLIVGITSLIYGAHNRAQIVEAHEMMREMAHERAAARAAEAEAKKPHFWQRLFGSKRIGKDAAKKDAKNAKALKAAKAAKKDAKDKKAKIETKLPEKEKK